jgi:hypothetical protein
MRLHFLRILFSPLFSTVLSTFLLGCSLSFDSSGRQSVSGASSHTGLELAETVEERAVSDVRQADTVFDVDLDADHHAWERARLFFEKYLPPQGDKAGVVTKVVGSRWALSNSASAGQYQYEVWRDAMRNGYRYSGTCRPLGAQTSSDSALLNAKNLARFIHNGELELSLISR